MFDSVDPVKQYQTQATQVKPQDEPDELDIPDFLR